MNTQSVRVKKSVVSTKGIVVLAIVAVFSVAMAFAYFLIPSGRVIYVQEEQGFNLSDTEMLIGWADNVFVAEVVNLIGTKSDDISPVTTYEVRVTENLKGELLGIVTVSHRIGYSVMQRAIIQTYGDEVLNTGESYLIISRYDEYTDSHWLVPVYGNIRLEQNERSWSELLDLYREKVTNQKDVDFGPAMPALESESSSLESPPLSDYRPMIFVEDKLFGQTARVVSVLPEGASIIGTVEKIVPQNQPMVHENFTSNSLPVVSEIFIDMLTPDVIYVKLSEVSQEGYSIFESIE